MRYLRGQTATVTFGPYADQVTGIPYLPDNLVVHVTSPSGVTVDWTLGTSDQLSVFETTGVLAKVPLPDAGEYLVRIDGGTDEQPVADSVRLFVDPDVVYEWAPSPDQVAAVLRSRTRGAASRDAMTAGEQGVFTTTTRPTRDQVQELIVAACGELAILLGGRTPCTALLQTGCTTAVTYRAAQLVEVSYFPEQTNNDQSAFSALQKMWETASKAVASAVTEQCPLPVDPDTGLDGGPIAAAGVIPGRAILGPQTGRW